MGKRTAESNPDQRSKVVGQVWQAAIAMLALSIPLCLVLRSPAVPIAVLLITALMTAYVWKSGQPTNVTNLSETDALKAKIRELEERLANVEVINRFEDRLAEKQVRQAEEKKAAAQHSAERSDLRVSGS